MRKKQCVIIWPAKDRVNPSVPATLTRKPVGGNQQFYYFLQRQLRNLGRPSKTIQTGFQTQKFTSQSAQMTWHSQRE